MFAERRRRRELKRKIEGVREELNELGPATLANINEPQRKALGARFDQHSNQLEFFESLLLIDKAERFGIDIPDRKDWWSNDNIPGDLSPDDVTWWLSQKGRIGLANLIKLERRKDFEWWLKIIAALTGLGGVLIGIISALKR
jgi:hypothetical protein